MSAYTVQETLDQARVLLNDTGSQQYTNTMLLPIFQIAFEELIRKVQNNGLGLTFEVVNTISVTAGSVSIDVMTAFPSLISPIWLKEKNVGAEDIDYQTINKRNFLPNVTPTTSISYWTWQQQLVKICPPTIDRSVQIAYQSDKPVLVLADPVPINNAKTFLSARTAAIAAFVLSNPSRAEVCAETAEERKDEVIRHGVNGKQNLPARRRAFSIYRAARYR